MSPISGPSSSRSPGGEPLLHPELDRVVAHARARGLVCTSITNGYAVTERWIDRLNEAKPDALARYRSDNMEPNESSEKTWRVLEGRLALLADHARFAVNVNAVLGACPPDETAQVAARVRGLGFFMTLGLMHGPDGQAQPHLFDRRALQLYDEVRQQARPERLTPNRRAVGATGLAPRHRAVDVPCGRAAFSTLTRPVSCPSVASDGASQVFRWPPMEWNTCAGAVSPKGARAAVR